MTNKLTVETLEKLTETEQLTYIAENLPELEHHEVISIFPMCSDSNREILKLSIEEDGQVHPILISRDFKLVDGRTKFDLYFKGELTGKPFLKFSDDPAADALNAHFISKNMNQQQRAALIYLTSFKVEQEKALVRKANKEGKGNTTKILSERYKIAREYFDKAHRIALRDDENNTYLKFVASGKASFKQINLLLDTEKMKTMS